MTRATGIITGPHTHLDHLGVLCQQLSLPVIVTDHATYEIGKKFYPDMQLQWVDFAELSLEFLASHFDLLLESGKFWAIELKPLFELFYGKQMKMVFCPHGNSDKGFSIKNHPPQDISLVYGQMMHDLVSPFVSSTIRTGNYRLDFYKTNQSFYDTLAAKEVFDRFDKNTKVIFYAPTWSERENPSSFCSACEKLIQELPYSFSLLIKLHPFLEEDHPAHLSHLMAKYEEHPRVVFLRTFPAIYPLLARSDIYLGDFSSIGYDFLAFDRPLFFLEPDPSGKRQLHHCGLTLPATGNLFSSIEQNLDKTPFTNKRQNLYHHAFEKAFSAFEIKQRLGI